MKMICLVWVLLTASSCSGLFYYPTQALYSNPEELGLKFENIFVQTEDGETLHSWYFEAQGQEKKGLIFFFHGNAQNITSHFRGLSWMIGQGYGLYIFDYRGYGLSTGQPNQAGLIKDARAAYLRVRQLHQDGDYPKLIFYGQSLGGNVMMRFLEEVDPTSVDLVVLDSTFPSYQRIAKLKLKKSGLFSWLQPLTSILVHDNQAPQKFYEHWTGPVLVIHGDQDSVVEPEWGREIFERLQTTKKQFWSIEGGGHIDAYFLPQRDYQEELLNLIKQL